MANPAAEVRAKAQEKWPGATLLERGHKHIKHQHPTDPKQFMLDHSIGPLHYGEENDQEIDTAWEPGLLVDAPWLYKMVKSSFNVYMGSGTTDFDSGQIIRYVHPVSGQDVTFQAQQLQWLSLDLDQIEPIADPQKISHTSIDDDTIFWDGAYGPGLDFRWQAQTARLAKYLTIQSLAAIGAPPQYIIDGGNPVLRMPFIFQKSNAIDIYIDGVLWDEKSTNPQTTMGNVEFRLSDTDEVLWWFKQPSATDLAENIAEGITQRFRATAANLFVEVLVPWTWLQSAVYPVEIDPTIDDQVGASGDDVHRTGATNFSTTATRYLRVGFDEIIGTYEHAFRFINTAGLFGATIDVSYLEVMGDGGAVDTTCYTALYADDQSAPGQITTYIDFDGRTLTSAKTDWDMVAGFSLGLFQKSPSLNTVIQELADSYESTVIQIFWKDAGNSGNQRPQIKHYDNAASDGAKLHIEYTLSGGGGTINKTFTFDADAEGFIAHPVADAVMAWDSSEKSLRTRVSGRKNEGIFSYWEWSGTWEDLGISAGDVITQVRLNIANTQCTEYNVVDACFIAPYDIYDSTGTSQVVRLWPGRTITAVDLIPYPSLLQNYQTISSTYEASNTSIKIRLYNTLNLGNNADAAVTIHDHDVSIDIDYVPFVVSDDLTATGITTTPVVGTSSIGQEHVLGAIGITTTSVVGTSSLGQDHILDAVDVIAIPIVEAPVLALEETNNLVTVGITTIPVVGTSFIGQEHILSTIGIITISVVGTASLGQDHILDAVGVVTTPVVGTSIIGQDHILDAVGITTTPVVGTPVLVGIRDLVDILWDDFDDDLQDTNKWDLGGSKNINDDPLVTVLEQNNRLEIQPRSGVTGAHYYGYKSVEVFDLVDSAFFVEVAQLETNGTANTQLYLQSGSQDGQYSLRIEYDSDEIYFGYAGGGATDWVAQTWNGTTMRWWRIIYDYSTDNVLWQYAPDGLNWITGRIVAASVLITEGIDLGQLRVSVSAGTWNSMASPLATHFDNVSHHPLVPRFEEYTNGPLNIIPHGDTAEVDEILWGAQAPGAIVKFGDLFFMYYIGADGWDEPLGTPTNRSLCVATSPDGINWTKYASNPIITYTTGGSVEEGVGGVAAIVNGTTIHLYYSAIKDVGGGFVDLDIRYRSSTDGYSFGNDTLILSSAGDEFNTQTVIYDGTNYHLYITGPMTEGKGVVRRYAGSSPIVLTFQEIVLDEIVGMVKGVDPETFITVDDIVTIWDYRNIERERFQIRTIDQTVPDVIGQWLFKWSIGAWTDSTNLINFYDSVNDVSFIYTRAAGGVDSGDIVAYWLGIPKTPLYSVGITTTSVVGTPSLGVAATDDLTAVGIITTPVVGMSSLGQDHILDAVGIITTPVVGTSVIGQDHILDAVGITTTPVVGTPSLEQDHILDAVGVTTTPVVGMSSLGQDHILDAVGIITTPVVGTPSLEQDHILDAVGVTTTPVVGTSVLGTVGEDNLVAVGITTTSVVGTPSLEQDHILDAVGVTTTPVVGISVIGQDHILDAVGVATTPIVGAPIIGQDHSLDAVDITTIPVVDTSVIGQDHILDVVGVATTPVVGAPVASQTHVLDAIGILTTPVVDTSVIGQDHILAVVGIVTTPVLDVPVLGTIGEDNLVAVGITTTPVVGTPSLGQAHIFDVVGIITTPVVGTSVIAQTHILDSLDIITNPVVGIPFTGQTHILSTIGITTTPEIVEPVIGQIQTLSAIDIYTTPVVESSIIGQVHILDVTTTVVLPILDTPTVGQTHILDATGITTTPEVGVAAFVLTEGLLTVIFTAMYLEVVVSNVYQPEVIVPSVYQPKVNFTPFTED